MIEVPLISVITINLNNLEGLKKTMSSVLEQTWQDYEYIVIDGCSRDGSSEYLKSNEEQLSYWVSEPDKGIFNAMNKGIKRAKGKYLLFLNSGDHLKDESILEKTKKHIEDQDLIYFDLEMYNNDRCYTKSFPGDLSFSFFVNNSLPHPATFIKKELLVQAGMYDESYKIISDWKFFIDAVCKKNCSYLYVNECLTSFNLFGISSTKEMRVEMYRERNKFLQENYSAFLKDFNDLEKCDAAIMQLRSSRKVKWLVQLGLIRNF